MANHAADLAGQSFGKLTAIKRTGKKRGLWVWLFRCECGNQCERVGAEVKKMAKRNAASSCGCDSHLKTHGLTKSHRRLQWVWSSMRRRCQSQSCKDYPNYGARGIQVCREWESFQVFAEWAERSGYQPGMTIERQDVNGNYEPGNCTWIKNEAQALNRRNNHEFTHHGRTQSIRAWSEESGIPYYTLRSRLLSYKWPIDRALKK